MTDYESINSILVLVALMIVKTKGNLEELHVVAALFFSVTTTIYLSEDDDKRNI